MSDPAPGSGQEGPGLARNSALVGGATMASRPLGFLRDMLIAQALGGGPVADAFLVAFRLPNLFRKVLGEGGFNLAFVPLYLALRRERGPAAASRFAGETIVFLGIGFVLLTILLEVFAPQLVGLIAPGLAEAPATFALAVTCTRLALPVLGFTVLASVFAAVLNAERRFLAAALAPALNNLGLAAIILVALLIAIDGAGMARLLALAVTMVGGLLFLLLAIALGRGSPGWPPLVLSRSRDLARLVALAGPALVAASSGPLILVVATQIASAEPGAVSWLYYAERIYQLPASLITAVTGVVLLPEITRLDAASQRQARNGIMDRTLVVALGIAVPAAVALALLADPIIAVLFEHGAFGARDRIETAAALAAFAPGLLPGVMAAVLSQLFFARRRPWGPFLIGLAAIGLVAVLGARLDPARPAVAAAAAASLAMYLQAALLTLLLLGSRLWSLSRAVALALLRIGLASAVMAVGLLLMLAALWPAAGTLAGVLALAALCLGGLALYGASAYALGLFRLDDLRHLRG